MSFLADIFNTIFYRPLFNALIFLYQYIPGKDFGVAIIILTLLIRLILYPLGSRAIKSQKTLAELQPQIKEAQGRNKDNKDKQMKEIVALYQKAKINPFSSLLPIIIQLPILIALYRVFWRGLNPSGFSSVLYSFAPRVQNINASFLGIIDLSKPASILENGASKLLWPNIILLILVVVAQIWQTRMALVKKSKSNSKKDISDLLQKQMVYFLPIFIVLTLWKLPSALAFYWLISTLFAVAQQAIIFKKTKPI